MSCRCQSVFSANAHLWSALIGQLLAPSHVLNTPGKPTDFYSRIGLLSSPACSSHSVEPAWETCPLTAGSVSFAGFVSFASSTLHSLGPSESTGLSRPLESETPQGQERAGVAETLLWPRVKSKKCPDPASLWKGRHSHRVPRVK